MPATAATGSVGDGAGVELAPAAGLDVLDLREALIRDRAKIEYLQGYARAVAAQPSSNP
ncbi:MAG: lysis protein [Burkholderiales bacterium]|nr:lysis protein [Burkholderiales bacterium]